MTCTTARYPRPVVEPDDFTTPTSAQRDENRLTDEDRAVMRARVSETMASWRWCGGPRERGLDSLAMTRLAAHSVGCGLADLRSSERVEVDALVAELFDADEAGQ